MSITVSQLYIHPIKSAAAISVNALELSMMGPRYDRRFMIVDEQGHFVTQREFAQLCFIKTAISEQCLTMSIDSVGEYHLELPVQGRNYIKVKVWGDYCDALDCGDQVADFLSDYLNKSVRLVFMPDDVQRLVDPTFAKQGETVGFADGFPLLLCNESSLQDFNQHLSQTITIKRFRPNIVISGAHAYAEDEWKTIQIGDLHFDIVKPCSRCVIPSINPLTGVKEPEVTQALAKHRRIGKAVYFGQNMLFKGSGVISIGDQVKVLS